MLARCAELYVYEDTANSKLHNKDQTTRYLPEGLQVTLHMMRLFRAPSGMMKKTTKWSLSVRDMLAVKLP